MSWGLSYLSSKNVSCELQQLALELAVEKSIVDSDLDLFGRDTRTGFLDTGVSPNLNRQTGM